MSLTDGTVTRSPRVATKATNVLVPDLTEKFAAASFADTTVSASPSNRETIVCVPAFITAVPFSSEQQAVTVSN
ncbi:MAG: hypothetical protein HIU84_12555 [Acidobacteria bacterium]|nr:hypothetical protein [Acidobacteriota bacterium]